MVPPREALGRVVTSRAFTIYQLANLVTRELPRVIGEHGSKFVIISDILSMFNDPSIDAKEASRVIEAIKGGLREVKKKRRDVFVLVTLTAKTPYDHLITDSADLLLNLSPANSKVAAMLLKHPCKPSLQPREEILRPILHQRYHRYG